MGMRIILFAFFIAGFFISSIVVALYDHGTVLPAVVVKAKKNHLSLSSGPAFIVTDQQIQAAGVSTLAQALQSLGGVQIQDEMGNGSQVSLNMRGFGGNASSNTLLSVNGIPLTFPDLAPPDLNAIPFHEIAYIEIIAGSESVLYGDQAVGGVINIMTHGNLKKGIPVSCAVGSYGLHYCYLRFDKQVNQWDHVISFSAKQADNYRAHSADEHALLSGRSTYHYARGESYVDYQFLNENRQYPGPLTAAQVRQNRRQASNSIDYFKDWNNAIHFKHSYEWNPNWQLETDIAGRFMQGRGVLFASFEQWRKTIFIKPTLKGTIARAGLPPITWISGLDAQVDDYRLTSLYGITNNDQQKYSIFTLINLPIKPEWIFSLGVRGAVQASHLQSFSASDTINRAIASTIGLKYQWTKNMDFYLRRAESFRFPKADENAQAPMGVKALRTQRGIAYETGMAYHDAVYFAKLGLYQLYLKDEISFDPLQTPAQPFGSNTNLSPTIRQGGFLSATYYVSPRLNVNGQYNYVNARFRTGIYSSNRIPLVAETVFRMGMDYRIAEHWNVYAETIYTGNQYAANDNTNSLGSIGGYLVYNLNIRFQHAAFTASLRLNNLFNKYYYFYAVNQSGSEFFYPAPGRNGVLTLNYHFS